VKILLDKLSVFLVNKTQSSRITSIYMSFAQVAVFIKIIHENTLSTFN